MRIILPGMLLLTQTAVADEKWDRVCDELAAAYKKGLAAVYEQHENWGETISGACNRSDALRGYYIKTYQMIADRLVKERGYEGRKCFRGVENWFDASVKKLHTAFEEDRPNGTLACMFLSGDINSLYDRAIRQLMLKTDAAKRWARISSATWRTNGTTVSFTNGVACVVRPFRIFKANPFGDERVWGLYYCPDEILSWNGKDYAVVRVHPEGSFGGYSMSTDERVLFEFDHSIVSRVIGLHNFMYVETELDAKSGRLILLGKDGHFHPVRFVIDLKTMKILKEGSKLSSGYIADGYDKLFVEGWERDRFGPLRRYRGGGVGGKE